MKLKLVWIVLILIAFIAIFNSVSNNNDGKTFKPLELEIGDEFVDIIYDKPMFVLNYTIGDVTADGEHDMVIAIGEKIEMSELFANNIDLVIYDTNNKKFIKCGIKKCSGKLPQMLLKDINGDSKNDIVLVCENEDMTRSIRVITIGGDECKEIFKTRDNKGIVFTGSFQDGFKAIVLARKIKFEKTIELNDKKENYVASGFYDEDGRVLKDELKITTSSFTDVELVEFGEGQYGIRTVQRINGFDELDILDQIVAIWKYENGTWNIKEAYGEKLGNLLY